jgi:hypothetical protein
MNYNPYAAPNPGAQQPQGQPAFVGSDYEFSHAENVVIDRLAGRLRWWGGLSLAFGVFALLGVVGGGLAMGAMLAQMEAAAGLAVFGGALVIAVPIVVIYVVTGMLYMGSGKAFRDVVNTQGNDIEYVMTAIGKMGKALRIEFWVSIIAYLFMGLAIFGLVVVAAMVQP